MKILFFESENQERDHIDAHSTPLLLIKRKHPYFLFNLQMPICVQGILAFFSHVMLLLSGVFISIYQNYIPYYVRNIPGSIDFVPSVPTVSLSLFVFLLSLLIMPCLTIYLLTSLKKGDKAYLIGIILLSMGVASILFLIQPFLVFQTNTQTNPLRILIGALLATTYFATGLSAFGIGCTHSLRAYKFSRGMNVYESESESLLPSEKSTIGRQIKYGKQYLFVFVSSMTLIGSIVFVCMILPPIWNRPLFDYLRLSDVDNSIINTFLWKLGRKPSEEETKNGWVYPMIVPKLFLNDIVFFSLISLFLFVGLISASFRKCRLLLRSQLYFGLNIGETFFSFLIVSLFFFESWYWVFGGSQRIMITALEESIAVSTLGGVYSASAGYYAFHGAASRISGHLASLAVSLTLLPAPKTSLLDDAFAISTQSAIVIHKRLGMLSWALTTSHFSLWLLKWFHEDNLFYNMFAVSRLKVSPSPLLDGSTAGEHTDNFTIPLVECAWLLLTVSLIIGVFLRDLPRWYSVFQVVHPLAVGFFLLSALIHAWGFWKYSVLGLLLILFEKVIRAIRTSTNIATVNTIKTTNGITHLVLNVCDFSFECGQYLFLSIHSSDGSFITSSLRSIERHPFSIASSPSKAEQFGTVSFIIRDRNHFLSKNVKSWTSHVALLANADYNVVFTLDGPYGTVFPYRDFKRILLVVGGVGVSAIIGLVEELLFHQQNEEDLGRLLQVDLIWSTKSSTCAGILSAVSKTLQEAQRSTLFRLHLFISDSDSSYLSEIDNSLFSEIRGRPQLDKFFKLVGREGCAAALVVGPSNMIQESNILGKIHNVSVYSNAWE